MWERPRRWFSTRASVVVTALLSVSVLLAGLGVVVLRQPPSEVSVDDAVAEFRVGRPGAGGPQADAVPQTPSAPETIESAQAQRGDGPATPTGGGADGRQEQADQPPPRSAAAQPEAPSSAPPPRSEPPPQQRPAPGSELPAEGVYTFRVDGSGETDALGGARHDYPEEVPVTVTHTDCGYIVRWQPLEERWDEWEFCADPDRRPMLRVSTYHEFFNRGMRQDFDCGGVEMFARKRAGQRYRWGCRSESSTIEVTAHVLGVRTIDIGGTPVEAVGSRHESVLRGANEGRQTFEWWLALDTGMPIEMTRSIQTRSQTPMGPANYHEESYSIATSTTPRR